MSDLSGISSLTSKIKVSSQSIPAKQAGEMEESSKTMEVNKFEKQMKELERGLALAQQFTDSMRAAYERLQ